MKNTLAIDAIDIALGIYLHNEFSVITSLFLCKCVRCNFIKIRFECTLKDVETTRSLQQFC